MLHTICLRQFFGKSNFSSCNHRGIQSHFLLPVCFLKQTGDCLAVETHTKQSYRKEEKLVQRLRPSEAAFFFLPSFLPIFEGRVSGFPFLFLPTQCGPLSSFLLWSRTFTLRISTHRLIAFTLALETAGWGVFVTGSRLHHWLMLACARFSWGPLRSCLWRASHGVGLWTAARQKLEFRSLFCSL